MGKISKNLVDLVRFFRNGGSLENFCLEQGLNSESEVIEIYMQKPFSLNSELACFEIEDTEGAVEYSFNSTIYYNLFDFYYFLDAIEESNDSPNSKRTDREIAEALLSYAINDA